ncbi:tryptophan--tRNA ligase [Cryobacterium sp. TMT1-21]|uniref:Tryptophan--tRNA ligase n=1 Tax=Cryobacterium shii TaxID=1259235 RepID=A0AAQ2HFS8_9MICO|nr:MULTISPECIES: tryptophan--tRNA ligase [Cryobacterium]TFC49413.1 tryptophan--tRNA ligase [Cryobacterium shii]TFC85617.1 tryptophan--tRNA ligase [Cryobacterium sp. TmT2-59]TFD15249.1 tryptophan--tRNA ligase [Cryobacterium sp. TMT1-21]TFD20255.1 tryptophan--tRNA ligase [Cryobacterium sp. TMT2-23]TFD20777.1 tryptophan--tRNA ligase [Cryobacterium sp. TMT4-10]
MTKPRLYSGMQPSADSLQIGNYIGALLNWKSLQETHEAYFSIVDLHALTVAQDPAKLRENTRRTAAQYIASGIDPSASTLYVQSHVAAHAQLAWVLNTITGFGEASRMTQFKDKSAKQGSDGTTVGLFAYPILMAADILLYDTVVVPVGEDQRQHVELTRDIAARFNSRFGDTFVIPEADIVKETAKIYDLQNPTSKMSKSAESHAGVIWLLDAPAVTAKKIMRAVTDADGGVVFDRENKPGVSNLLTIYSVLAERSVQSIEDEYAGRGYGDLKKGLAEVVTGTFGPIRSRVLELLDDPAELDRLLALNADRAAGVANATLARAFDRVGLLPRR